MPELQEDGANPEAHRRHNQKSAAPAASASATASSPRPPLTSQAKLEELRAESVRSSAARTAEEKKAYAKSNLEATKKMFLSYCAKPSPAEPKVSDSYSIFPLLLAHHIIPQLRFAPTKSSRRCMGRHEARARGRRACVRAQESEPRAAPLSFASYVVRAIIPRILRLQPPLRSTGADVETPPRMPPAIRSPPPRAVGSRF